MGKFNSKISQRIINDLITTYIRMLDSDWFIAMIFFFQIQGCSPFYYNGHTLANTKAASEST
jgi:hypothetical protein